MLNVVHETSAVTGACLLVNKAKYLAVGGLDEETFRVAFNDLDLCQKLGARGWRTLYTPHAVLVHHESKSRGSRVDASEDRAFRQRYHALIVDDPFYHPALSRLVADYRLG
jgi:GT2 family glycosyltransferase